MLQFNQVVKILKNHGWNLNQQTATLKGQWVAKGTSFLETFGIKDLYNAKAIYEWLGY